MPRTVFREHQRDRRLVWLFAVLLAAVAFGYARFDSYVMDGDGTAFLDIAEALSTHRPSLALNGYWNPGYPAILALAERIAHPSLWRELTVVRYTNVFIVLLSMAATVFFTRSLSGARQAEDATAVAWSLSPAILDLLGLALLLLSLGRELPVAAPRSDTLLYALLVTAAGLLVRLLGPGRRPWHPAALGFVLGCAFLTKSFAFLPSIALLAALAGLCLLRGGSARLRRLAGVAVALLVFAALAGPYIVALSRLLGHFSTGESARLNYAFFIDLTPRWHEWFHGDLGRAGGPFRHPEAVLVRTPPVFSYAAHPFGTYPLWFDPAYWTLGLKPHVWLRGHLLRLLRNMALLVRFLLGRPEMFVVLGMLLATGSAWRKASGSVPSSLASRHRLLLAPLAWGVLMLAIYFPVDLQDRYLTAPLFLIVLPLFAGLRLSAAGPETASSQHIARALVLLFALLTLSQAVTYLLERRRHTPPAEQAHPGFDPQIFTAAAALRALGVHPGDKVACMGDLACYTDHYWARLAGVQILGEVETPGEANPIAVWNAIPDKTAVTAPLTREGLRYIVSLFPNSTGKPTGWVQLGGSNFFAYPLDRSQPLPDAAAIAAFRPAL